MKFEIFKGEDDKYYFRGKGNNGEKILASQVYSSKQAAQKTIDTIKNEAETAEIEDLTR